MTTEARKAYEHRVPRREMVLRDRLKNEKGILSLFKEELPMRISSLQTEKDAERIAYIEKHIEFLQKAIKEQKKVIQLIKNALPQRRPKGVMAKCPFCGAKQSASLTLKNGKGEGVTVKALYALENVFDDFMAVGCRNCGARIAYPKYDDTTIQDLIDMWNRRA